MRAILVRAIPVPVAAAAALLVVFWLRAGPSIPVEERLPVPATHQVESQVVAWPGQFTKSDVEAPDLAGSWPCFRGPDHDGISHDETPLVRSWGPEGPKPLWSVPVGVGYGAAAVRNGRVYLLDYDEAAQADTLRCLALATGKELWRRGYRIPIASSHGITRTIPAVVEPYVVTMGPKCHVMCADSTSGEFLWGLDLVKEFGTTVPQWYTGQCPLIDAGRAILAPAGKDVLMVGIECGTGRPAWTTPNRRGWKMTHSSIIPMDYKDRHMYVYCGSGGVVGVAGFDGDNYKAGDILWEREDWHVNFASVPSPVPIGDGRILLSGGYGTGSMMIRLKEEGGRLTSEIVWRIEKSKEFGSEQQTPIFYNGHIFAVLPSDAGALAGQMVCLDLEGKHVWTSGPPHRFGLGPYMIADGLILAMDDNGRLTLVEASSVAYKELAEATVLDGHETWGPMALAGGRLIVRDLQRMVCLDLRKEPGDGSPKDK